MTTITLPATLKLGAACGMGQRRFDLLSQSDATGTQQARLLGPPRWTLALVQPEKVTLLEAGAWAALAVQLRGRVNVLAAWDPVRSAPQGTLRGTLALNIAAAAGATSVQISGGSPVSGTLKAGDWLSIGSGLGSSQLVMVTADATASGGLITVNVEPPLRTAFGSATAVTWDKALAYYRVQGDATAWTYGSSGTMATGFAFDLLETWS